MDNTNLVNTSMENNNANTNYFPKENVEAEIISIEPGIIYNSCGVKNFIIYIISCKFKYFLLQLIMKLTLKKIFIYMRTLSWTVK